MLEIFISIALCFLGTFSVIITTLSKRSTAKDTESCVQSIPRNQRYHYIHVFKVLQIFGIWLTSSVLNCQIRIFLFSRFPPLMFVDVLLLPTSSRKQEISVALQKEHVWNITAGRSCAEQRLIYKEYSRLAIFYVMCDPEKGTNPSIVKQTVMFCCIVSFLNE